MTSSIKEFIPKNINEYKNDDILKALQFSVERNRPALLMGETGTGKTSSVRWIAHQQKQPYRRINLNGQTNTDEIIGKLLLNEKGTVWVDGVLTHAVRNGLWVLLDEVNAAQPEVLIALHSLTDDDAMLTLNDNDGEIVKPHKNFRLFAALNHGYEGTRLLNKAFISRFPIVLNYSYLGWEDERGMTIKTEVEVLLLMERTGIDEKQATEIVNVGNSLRQTYIAEKLSFPVSFRELVAWAELIVAFGVDKAFQIAVINKLLPEERAGTFSAYKLKTSGD